MAFFESTNKLQEKLPDLTKEKKLSKLLGTDFLLNKIRKLSGPEIGNFRLGALALTIAFGSLGYYFYRQNYKQKFTSSTSYYKMVSLPALNAGNQFMFNGKDSVETNLSTWYYRMPLKEFDIKYRMRSAYIQGEFDHDKEVLIPKIKNGVEGYDVITPFYYYQVLTPSRVLSLQQDGKPFVNYDMQNAAMAVFRGWVPAALKDRRLRPHDVNKGEKETILGTIKLSQIRRHDFKQANDPSHNLWTNYSLEDMALFWNLPNVNDAKFCYFQEVNFGSLDMGKKDVYPIRPSLGEAIVEDGKEKEVRLDRPYRNWSYATSSAGAFFAYLMYLAA